MSNILDQALSNGAFQLNEGYYHAYRTEISSLDNDAQATLSAGQQALALLPQQEVLLRARVTARVAEAAFDVSNIDKAVKMYEIAYQQDPSILRRLETSLPVNIVADESLFSDLSKSFLVKSPRFREVESGLILEIKSTPLLSICLKSRSGSPLSCYTAPASDNQDNRWDAQKMTRQFHTQAFGLGYDISKAQRSTLLGSSVILSSQNDSNLQLNSETILER
jgi:hypothetical protein